MSSSMNSAAELLIDPDGPFGLSPDLFTNAVTEVTGVIISIFISIFFAIWLDRRFDSTRRVKQMRFLQRQLIYAYNELSTEIPQQVTELVKNNNIPSGYGTFYIHTKRVSDNIRQLIDNLLSSYGLDIDPSCVTALNDIKFTIYRLFDIADMETSISLRQALSEGSLEEEAILLENKYRERLSIIKENIAIFERGFSRKGSASLSSPEGLDSEVYFSLLNYVAREFLGAQSGQHEANKGMRTPDSSNLKQA